jgi:putative peptidoglycan lipid II flippase
MRRGFWILLFLLSLATAGGILFSTEIIWLLFERGAFGRDDTLATAGVLRMYMIGLLPFGLGKLFSLWLYSRHEQMRAASIATWSLAGYALLAFLLFRPLGPMGLALASTFSGFVSFTLLVRAFGAERFLGLLERRRLMLWAGSLSFATCLMWGVHLWTIRWIGL